MKLDPLLRSLLALSRETEWVEFKHNNDAPEEIGEYLSALANGAALHGQEAGYLVWGIEERNYPMASRIIAETLKVGLIKPESVETKSKKLAKYVPFWL